MIGHRFDMRTGVIAAEHTRIEIRVGSDQIEVRCHMRDGLELNAANAHLASLDRKVAAVRISREAVGYGGVEHRTVDREVTGRIVFEADLVKFATLRLAVRHAAADAATED